MLLALSVLLGASANPYYDAGSQMFTINVGPTVPFFTYNGANNKAYFWPGINPAPPADPVNTNTLVGGIGSISYQVFLSPYWALGGELGYQFDFSRSGDVSTNVPITAKLTYVPVQGDFDIPISLGLGMDYISYDSYSKISFGLTFEVGFRYYFTESWGDGINTGLLVVPEVYFDRAEKNSVMTYIPATISVTYRH